MALFRKTKIQIVVFLSALAGLALTGISLLSWPDSIQFLSPIAWILGPFVFFWALTTRFRHGGAQKFYRQKSRKEKLDEGSRLEENRKKFVPTICRVALSSIVLLVLSSLLLQHAIAPGLHLIASISIGVGALFLVAMVTLATLAIFQPTTIEKILQNTFWDTVPKLSKPYKSVFLLLTGLITVVTSLLWAFTPSLPYTITNLVIGVGIGGVPFLAIGISMFSTIRKSSSVMHISERDGQTPPGAGLTDSKRVFDMQHELTARTAAAWTNPLDAGHLHSPTTAGQGSPSPQVILSQPTGGSFSVEEASARLEQAHGNSGIELELSGVSR